MSHIEAGLRTFDTSNPYPEESYRQMISAIASYHYAPTQMDFDNLVRERQIVRSARDEHKKQNPICGKSAARHGSHKHEKGTSTTTGKTFYYDTKNNESSYERPEPLKSQEAHL